VVTATEQALETARVAVAAAADKKAHDIVVLDVSDQLVITDCFVIASAPNERQVEAIVDAVEEKLRERGTKPVRREGAREGRWVLLDFIDVVVHVQHNEERGFYGLERLWKDCPRIEFAEARVGPVGDEAPLPCAGSSCCGTDRPTTTSPAACRAISTRC
jgi:ribosome-associated protein